MPSLNTQPPDAPVATVNMIDWFSGRNANTPKVTYGLRKTHQTGKMRG